MSNRDTLDNPSSYRLGGDLLWCPVSHGEAIVLRLLTCQRNNLNQLFRTELRFNTGAIQIRKRHDDLRLQLLIRCALRFRFLQTTLGLKPPSSPSANALWIHTKLGRLVQIDPTLRRTQHDPNTFGQPLRCLVSTNHRFENSPHSL